MAKISVPEMDAYGVVVDLDRLNSVPGQLSKAQNAVADPTGEKGSIRKRPGLLAINGTAGNGTIRGGIGVPRTLGSAGPDIGNPFTDISVTIAQYTTATTSGISYVQRLGTTFNDESEYFFWDWNDDFPEVEISEFEWELITDEMLQQFAPWDFLDTEDDLFDVTGDGAPILDIEGAAIDTLVPLTFFGDVTGFWYLALDTALAHDTDNGTTDTNTQTLVFPTGSVRAYNASGAGTGGSGDANYPLAGWYSGQSGKEDGYPSCVLNNVMYYVGGYDDYTVGTNAPVLRAYDGYTDTVVLRIPRNPDVSSTAEAKAIVALLPANGKLYLSTYDGGANGAGGGTIKGSVYEFNPSTQKLTKLGATFPTGHMPYSLLWAYGRVWCGTAINRASDVTPARVYWFRPSIDATWTLDKTFDANEDMCMALAVFQGLVYAAVNNNIDTGDTAKVYVRSTAGAWSNSDTGTTTGGGSGNYDNGYTSLLVWPPENASVTSPTPALFAVRRRIVGDADTGAIRKFNGSSWSTVYTFDYAGAGSSHLDLTYAISGTTIVPVIWLTRGVGLFPNSTNGTSWTDRSASLTTNAAIVGSTAGHGGLILQLSR